MNTLAKFFSENFNALLVSLVANTISAFTVWYVKAKIKHLKTRVLVVIGVVLLSGTIGLLLISWFLRTPKKAEVVYSDFNNCFALNNYKVHWGVLNDNPFSGDSNVTIEIHPTPASELSSDCYAVLSYFLGDKATIRPYCGMFSWFAPKPIHSRDISSYNGMQLECWHEGNLPEGIRVYLQISPYELIDSYDGYLECDITSELKKNTERREISFLFSKFKSPPSWTNPTALSKELQASVYQISLIIQGEKGRTAQGKLDVDNLRFF